MFQLSIYKSENIRWTAGVERIGVKLRESTLRSYGQKLRRADDYMGRRVWRWSFKFSVTSMVKDCMN